ncbi:MAG: DUF58 domain-containing protein [Theionarchaea archaeon]|nr:DUF58 domain-containing protein [Theionarchaea archaeon]
MFTLKFFALTTILLLSFGMGAAFRSADLLALCLPLLFYFFFAIQGEKPETKIERPPLPERAMAESVLPISLVVSVKNPTHVMEVFDNAKGRIIGGNYFLLPGLCEAECDYDLLMRRGTTRIGPAAVRHRNFLLTQFWEHTQEVTNTIVVIPRVHDLKPLKMKPRHTRVFYGTLPARRAGIGEEFYSLREYFPGDEFRKINWKASSRFGKLVLNEFEALKITDVIIVLDARRENRLGEDKSILDYSLDAAASIAAAALKGGNRLGFLSYGESFHRLYPGTTRRHLLKILEILTEIRPDGSLRLDYVRNFISAFFSRGSQLILVSPMMDPSFLKGVQGLYSLGFDIMVVSPSPVKVQWLTCEKDVYHELSRKILEKERARLFSQLQEYAITVDWDVELPLAQPLSEVKLFHQRR